ncbi:MAG: MBL fold metallo-hydrolase [Bacteroidia bacterium]
MPKVLIINCIHYRTIKLTNFSIKISIITLLFSSIIFGQNNGSFIICLGIAQDGGYPHLGCQNNCCNIAWENDSNSRYIVSYAIADSLNKKWYLFEATPDIKKQIELFKSKTNQYYNYLPDAIFITHAHIGHYTGLMEFGREVMSTNNLPVYVLPKLKSFLENNGPWSQLVELQNITLNKLSQNIELELNNHISVTTFTVPHRDEYSETAGFQITFGKKKALFIPDIDKWAKWSESIVEKVRGVDYAFIDATFMSMIELKNRNIKEVPHPLISETMDLFKNESSETKSKIYFTHFNHTNPVLIDSKIREEIRLNNFNLSEQGKRYY